MAAVRGPRPLRRAIPALAGIMLLSAAPAVASASVLAKPARPPAVQLKVVSYRGYLFDVPRSWPVIKASVGSPTCVRFDVHAVYLGAPGVNEDCPSWLVGATEAILIQPGPARGKRVTIENPVANSITATAPRIRVTATFDTSPTTIYRILASANLAAPVIVSVSPARLAAQLAPSDPDGPPTVAPGKPQASQEFARPGGGAALNEAALDLAFGKTPAILPAAVTNRLGLGFDACAAPSAKYMRAWRRRSPYRAIGIYIGGSDRACDQRNLTSRWVRQQAAAGWRFMPMYVGPQASFRQLHAPARQGMYAAADAVEQARRLGFGPLTPLYYDMEAFRGKYTRAALVFLSAWTRELHRLGYFAGVYSSSGSGIAALARVYRNHRFAMPDVIYDALWNGSKNVADRVYRRGEWTNRRRVHQFSGNVLQTFGGDTMDIDQDYLDLGLSAPGGTTEAAAATAEAGGLDYAFYEGADHRLWEEYRAKSGRWRRVDLWGYLTAGPSVVQTGRSSLAVFYRSRSGHLTVVRRRGGHWGKARQLYMMGIIGGGPHAVAQPNGVIDVFWPGQFDRHLWHGEYDPGIGWSGPQRLGGKLASAPSPVETRPGTIEVFWEGTDHKLWRVVRGVGTRFSRPEDLGMGPLGGAPHAVALPSGRIDVFWRGSTRPHHVWAAFITAGRARGPSDLGGRVVGQPWPVFAAGAERVFFRGRANQLWVVRRYGRHFGRPRRAAKVTRVTASPFAAAGRPGAPLLVFWRGARDMLWTMRYAPRQGWQPKQNLGGRVAG
jgi:hypothetical protein